MEQAYSYRGFDVIVNATKEGSASGHSDTDVAKCAYVAGVTLKTSLIAGEWSTDFRVEPAPGRSPGDLREVLAAGFSAATKVIDDVIGVMGDVLAGRPFDVTPQVS